MWWFWFNYERYNLIINDVCDWTYYDVKMSKKNINNNAILYTIDL